MTNWWEVDPMSHEGETAHPEPDRNLEPIAPARPEPAEEVTSDAAPPDRRRGLLLGAAGAAIVGAVLFVSLPHDGSSPASLPVTPTTASQGSDLPAAGGQQSPEAQSASTAPVPKVVTMVLEPAGTGRVGAVMKVAIHNGTDSAIVVLPSMMKGDDRPALLGEGTLAPNAREVEPGKTAIGTVEFAAKKPPAQVVLFDTGGNVVAASG